MERADDHEIHRVGHLAAVLALELDPLPPARPRLVGAARGFADQSFAPVLDGLLEDPLELVNRGDLGV